jgi:hypothetical protein
MTRSLPIWVAVVLLLAPVGARAQEVQVALDEDGRLEEIDRRLAERLGLFIDQYPDLEVIRLYRVDEARFVLEVTYREDGRVARIREELTGAEVADLRSRITQALTARAPEAALNQEGRSLLLGGTTIMGLGYWGWAVPLALGMDDGRGILAAYMLTAGGSFLIPYIYTGSRPVTYGMANAGFWGTTRGAMHGVYLANLLDDSPSEELWGGLSFVTSVGEGLAGYSWAKATDMSAGDAHVIGNYGDYGHNVAGFGLLMLQPDSEPLVFGTLLAGSVGGLLVGRGRARALPYSWGDAEVERTAVLLGAGNGGALFDLVAGDDPSDDQFRLLGGLLLGGSAAGLLVARRMLRDREFSAGQGILVDLGTLAGALTGLGVGALVGPEDGDETLYFSLAALGADIGFLATFGSLARDAERRQRPGTGGIEGLELDVNPGALLLLRDGVSNRIPRGVGVPLLSARFRF